MSFRFKQIIKFLKNNREKIDYIIFEDGMSEMLVLVAKVFPTEKNLVIFIGMEIRIKK